MRAGFSVEKRAFEFSELPARWGPPVGSVMLAFIILLCGDIALRNDAPLLALVIAFAALALVVVVERSLLRTGTVRLPVMRNSSVNLVATRGTVVPRVWVVAHLDSKSQTIPMLVRVASIALCGVFIMLTLGQLIGASVLSIPGLSTALDFSRETSLDGAWVTSIGAVVAITPMMICLIGNKSRGALDNATGVAAVLMAAEMLGAEQRVGIIITSAEELGLAGARAHLLRESSSAMAINCDTVDDHGRFICMSSREPKALTQAIRRAAAKIQIEIQVRGMIPGILADNVAFTDAGWDSVTISRGNLSTLLRVHSRRDTPENLSGAGIVQAAQLMAATIEELN